jgi:hypothetical protein
MTCEAPLELSVTPELHFSMIENEIIWFKRRLASMLIDLKAFRGLSQLPLKERMSP